MESLERKILAAEEAYLGPAMERLKAHNDAAEERVHALKSFNERQANLARRLEKTLQEVKRERDALRQEWQRLYGKNSTPPASAI